MWTGVIPADVRVPDRVGWWAQYVFTNRSGGVSEDEFGSLNLATHVGDRPAAVSSNRQVLASRLCGTTGLLPPPRLVVMGAKHGASVAIVDQGTPHAADGFDGLVTSSPDVALVALAADCVPMVLVDVSAGVAAAAHCGWQGLVAGIVDKTIDSMLTQGAKVQNLTALVGPAICGRCYGVSGERADSVARFVPAAVTSTWAGGLGVDVRVGVLEQLRRRQVRAGVVGGCTFEDPHLFSHRRDGVTGRHGAAIVLRGADSAP